MKAGSETKTSLRQGLGITAGIILGIVFGAAGFGKLFTSTEGFTTIFNPFPAFLGTVFNDIVFNWLPFLEILVGLLLIIGVVPRLAGSFTALLVAGFIVNNTCIKNNIRSMRSDNCYSSYIGYPVLACYYEISGTGLRKWN